MKRVDLFFERRVNANGNWVCPRCGTTNTSWSGGRCSNCGNLKP